MILILKLAVRMRADAVLNAGALWWIWSANDETSKSSITKTYMMSINTVLNIAILAAGARVQASQERDSVNLVFGRLILVFKAACLAL